jgi:hypothetical protein
MASADGEKRREEERRRKEGRLNDVNARGLAVNVVTTVYFSIL